MAIFRKVICLIALSICYTNCIRAQINQSVTIPLNDLDFFNNAGSSWVTASSASADFAKPKSLKFTKGTGLLVNTSKKEGESLITKEEFGDVEVSLDFMMSRSGASGIYLMGRYGINLAGSIPLMNAARAPGLWQHIKIVFRTPKFENNTKIKNARFETVYLNGTLIQQQIEATGPAGGAVFQDERSSGPLMLQGDGVVFRNISLTNLQPEPGPAGPQNPLSKRRDNVVNPIVINVESKPYLLRSYMMFDQKKHTHIISVGSPQKVSYSYDLKQGALLQVWRGQFMDVTEMWNERGEPQLAKPLGSVLTLSSAPSIAFLADMDAAWPDSIAFDDLQNKGYVLDKSKMPAFMYISNGTDVSDKISVLNNGESLERTITLTHGQDRLYCRLAAASNIEVLKNGMYSIGDKSYYIKIDNKFKPIVRKTKNGQEILVPVSNDGASVTYSLIW